MFQSMARGQNGETGRNVAPRVLVVYTSEFESVISRPASLMGRTVPETTQKAWLVTLVLVQVGNVRC